MSKTATATVTFADLARRHGRALAYIAGRDSNPVPDSPTTVDADGLIDLVTNAAAFLTQARRDEDAETLESAASYLADARDAATGEQPVFLRRAAECLRDSYDMADELADDLGDDDRDF